MPSLFQFRHSSFAIRHSLFLLAFTLGVIALAPARAQAPTPPEAPKPAKLRFLFLDESTGAYALKIGKGYQQLSGSPYAISPVFTPATADRIELYKTSTHPDPVTKKIERTKIADFIPPVDTTSALVVVTPKPAKPGVAPVYTVNLIESSTKNFPLGSIRILNLGHVTMAAQFGASQVTVEPGASQIVQPSADRRYRILAKIAAKTGESWELRSDNLVILRPEQRITGIFFYSPSGMIHTYPPDEILEHGPPPPGHFWLTYVDSP